MQFLLLGPDLASWHALLLTGFFLELVCYREPCIQAVPNHMASSYPSSKVASLLQYTSKKIFCWKQIKIDNNISEHLETQEVFWLFFPESPLRGQTGDDRLLKLHVSLFQSLLLHLWGMLLPCSCDFLLFLWFRIALVQWHHYHLRPQNRERRRWLSGSLGRRKSLGGCLLMWSRGNPTQLGIKHTVSSPVSTLNYSCDSGQGVYFDQLSLLSCVKQAGSNR